MGVFDPAFERVAQPLQIILSGQADGAGHAEIPLGSVGPGNFWLIEREVVVAVTTNAPPNVSYAIYANDTIISDTRDATTAFQTDALGNLFAVADNSSPIRFYPSEQVVVAVDGLNVGELVVVSLQGVVTVLAASLTGPGGAEQVKTFEPPETDPDPGWGGGKSVAG